MSLRFPTSSRVEAEARTVDGTRTGRVSFPVRYGLFAHRRLGPILVDTGYTRELAALRGLHAALYRRLLAPALDPTMDPEAVLAREGLRPSDVRHLVLTHLHPDHASGLARFGHAVIHASRRTIETWTAQPGRAEALHGLLRGLLPAVGAMRVSAVEHAPRVPLPWGGSGHDILGDGSMVAVPLPGHMAGHVGVLFPDRDRPLLYAVDASWTRAGYREGRLPPLPLRLSLDDPGEARASMRAVLAAEDWGAEVVLCHDPQDLDPDLR